MTREGLQPAEFGMSAPNPYTRGKTNRRGYLWDAPTAEQFDRVTLGIKGGAIGDRYVVTISAALVATNTPALERAVVDGLAAGVRTVELEMGLCDRIDGRGLGVLVKLASIARRMEPSATITLRNVCATVRERLRAMRVDSIVGVEEVLG